MTRWTKWLVPVLVVAMVGVADAKGAKGAGKHKKGGGLKGKITAVAADGSSITVHTGKKKNGAGQDVTIATTKPNLKIEIDGQKGKSVRDLAVGEKVVVNPLSGPATDIKAKAGTAKGKAGKGKKKKNA